MFDQQAVLHRTSSPWRYLCLVLIPVLVVGILLGQPLRRAEASPSPDGLIPLPRECGGVNPPGYPVPACCAFGYVHDISEVLTETLIVEGATVTLTTQEGVVTSTCTAPGLFSPEPYFKFDLERAGVEPGDWVTFTTAYRDKQDQVVYQVVPAGQQVDLVLAEARGFEQVTVIVDDEDEVSDPSAPGFYRHGPDAEWQQIVEGDCGPGSEFWGTTMYSGTTLPTGPATISATYRPNLPISGTYELFAYAPHGCAQAFARYNIHIPGKEVTPTVVAQHISFEEAAQWVSLGLFDLPTGTESYVSVDNVTGQINPRTIGLDALKWEFRSPFPAIAVTTVDEKYDQVVSPGEAGFYKNTDPSWCEATTQCEPGLECDPIYWRGHIFWTQTIVSGPEQAWAQWRPSLPHRGTYDLYTYVPMCYGETRSSRYEVYGDEEAEPVTVIVDQGPQGGVWVHGGSYDLPAGDRSRVRLSDVTGENLKNIAFDAMRWILWPPFRPVGTIHSIRPSEAVAGEDIVSFRGSGTDTDDGGTGIAGYRWESNRDGVLSSSDTFTIAAADLAMGTHVVTFTVQDDEGQWSPPVVTHLEVHPSIPQETWHLMLYFAGDNNLSFFLNEALYRLQQLSNRPRITVTVQLDRPTDSGVRRYLVRPDQDCVWGETCWSLDESSTGDPAILGDYILWAQENHPADHYYLAIADHGRGTQGIAWDDTSGGDYLALPELRQALQYGSDNGLLKIDLLHLDACLMGMAEVAYEIWPYADYMVASENLAWALFGYDQYVRAITSTTTPRDLARSVTDIYHQSVHGYPHTISALDLAEVGPLVGKVDNLSTALIEALPGISPTLDTALDQVQRFDSQDYGYITDQDEYIDLHHLAELLMERAEDEAVREAARKLFTATLPAQAGALTTTVVEEKSASGRYNGVWWDLDNAYGVAIYFPPSANSWDYGDYISPTLRLGFDTHWDELLEIYLGLPGTPPETPAPPPPMELWRVYLPVIFR